MAKIGPADADILQRAVNVFGPDAIPQEARIGGKQRANEHSTASDDSKRKKAAINFVDLTEL